MSMIGYDAEQLEKIKAIRMEEEIRRQQLRDLETAIKGSLQSEIEYFKRMLQSKYVILDLKRDVLEIRKDLKNDARGNAKDAADDRLITHYRMMTHTNMDWDTFINNFGFGGLWNRLW